LKPTSPDPSNANAGIKAYADAEQRDAHRAARAAEEVARLKYERAVLDAPFRDLDAEELASHIEDLTVQQEEVQATIKRIGEDRPAKRGQLERRERELFKDRLAAQHAVNRRATATSLEARVERRAREAAQRTHDAESKAIRERLTKLSSFAVDAGAGATWLHNETERLTRLLNDPQRLERHIEGHRTKERQAREASVIRYVADQF
jgi:hypothetical protein